MHRNARMRVGPSDVTSARSVGRRSCSAAAVGVISPARTSASTSATRSLARGAEAGRAGGRRSPTTSSGRPGRRRCSARRPGAVEVLAVGAQLVPHRCRGSRRSSALHVSTGVIQPSSRGAIRCSAPASSLGRALGVAHVGAVGLVDGDDVGQLEHALLDALQAVAGAGEREQQERVDHVGDGDLGLADADGLDEHDVEAGRLDDDDRLARRPGDAAEHARRRRRADERQVVDGRGGPCASCRRGCCRRCASTTGRRRARRRGCRSP